MRKFDTKTLTGCALMVALQVILARFAVLTPNVTTRLSIEAVPVFIAGMLYGPMCGASVGVLAPTLSFLIFGMPPAAKYPFMLIELILYGLAAGVFERALRRFETANLILTTFLSQLVGRLVYAGCLWLGGRFLVGAAFPAAATVAASLTTALPGIVVQLVLVPAAYTALRRFR